MKTRLKHTDPLHPRYKRASEEKLEVWAASSDPSIAAAALKEVVRRVNALLDNQKEPLAVSVPSLPKPSKPVGERILGRGPGQPKKGNVRFTAHITPATKAQILSQQKPGMTLGQVIDSAFETTQKV